MPRSQTRFRRLRNCSPSSGWPTGQSSRWMLCIAKKNLCGRPPRWQALRTLPKRLIPSRPGGTKQNEPRDFKMAVSCCPVALEAGSIPMSAEEACLAAPPMSAVSPVRSLLATGPPEDLQHDCAAPARHRALPPSRCLPGWRAGCPATPETGPAGCPPSLHRVSPPFRSTAPIGRATVSDNHRRLHRRSRGSNLAPRPAGRGSLGGGRGAIAAGWWSWHPGLISRDASRVQWTGVPSHEALSDVGERSGQVRPYVRPVARYLPLAIMGVRMRVRHQSFGRARGTNFFPVSPELF